MDVVDESYMTVSDRLQLEIEALVRSGSEGGLLPLVRDAKLKIDGLDADLRVALERVGVLEARRSRWRRS